jgi:hypothetical protein
MNHRARRERRSWRSESFFRFACEPDVEGIVTKLKIGAYGEGGCTIRKSRVHAVRRSAANCPRKSERQEPDDLQLLRAAQVVLECV